MPDRVKRNSEELLEQGWREMHATLDKEMPQKKRRLLWLPLMMLLVAAMGTTAWLTMSESQESGTEVQPAAAKEVGTPADAETIEQTRDVNTTEVLSAVQHDLENTQATSSENTPSSVIEIQQTASLADNEATMVPADRVLPISAQQSSDLRDVTTANEENSVATVAEPLKTAVVETSVVESKQEMISEQANTSGPSETMLAVQKAETRSNIDIADIGTTVILLDTEDTKQPTIPVASIPSKAFGLDVFAATHFVAGPLAIQGLEAGLGLSWYFAPRWKLSSGLSYGHYNDDGIAELNFRFSKTDDAEIYGIGVDPPDTTGPYQPPTTLDFQSLNYDTAKVLVTSYNYLHMPVTAEYHLNKWLSIRSGLRISYLLNAPVQEGLSRVSGANTTTQTSFTTAPSNALVEQGVLQRWDVAPVLGLSINAGPIFSVDLQYQHGLIPYIDRPTQNRTDFNRSLSLGLRFRLI